MLTVSINKGSKFHDLVQCASIHFSLNIGHHLLGCVFWKSKLPHFYPKT